MKKQIFRSNYSDSYFTKFDGMKSLEGLRDVCGTYAPSNLIEGADGQQLVANDRELRTAFRR